MVHTNLTRSPALTKPYPMNAMSSPINSPANSPTFGTVPDYSVLHIYLQSPALQRHNISTKWPPP